MILLSFIVFILISIAIGVLSTRYIDNSAESFFISHRNLGKWALGISASATANSGFVVIGAVGMGYSLGLKSLLYPLAWFIGDLVFWYFFANRINKMGKDKEALTLGALVSSKNNKFLVLLLGIITVTMLTVYASAQYDAAGKTLSSFFEVDTKIAMIISFLIVVSYITWGGFKSSIWTDLFQGVMMVLLTTYVVIWGLIKVGGFLFLYQKLSQIDLSLVSIFDSYNTITLILFMLGFAFAGFGFSMSQPQVTSRIMAGKDSQSLKQSKWVYIGILHYTWIGMCFIGMIVRVLIPDLQDGEKALPILATEYYHPTMIGFVLAGMFSAIISSLDSLLLASSTIISTEFLGQQWKKNNLRSFRITLVIIAIVALLLSTLLTSSVFQVSLFAATILASTVGACVFIVVSKIPNNNISLSVGVLSGFSTSIAWRLMGYHNLISDAIIGFAITIIINYVILYIQKKTIS